MQTSLIKVGTTEQKIDMTNESGGRAKQRPRDGGRWLQAEMGRGGGEQEKQSELRTRNGTVRVVYCTYCKQIM